MQWMQHDELIASHRFLQETDVVRYLIRFWEDCHCSVAKLKTAVEVPREDVDGPTHLPAFRQQHHAPPRMRTAMMYSAHRQELPVLSRWFEAGTVETPEAKFLDIILYRFVSVSVTRPLCEVCGVWFASRVSVRPFATIGCDIHHPLNKRGCTPSFCVY